MTAMRIVAVIFLWGLTLFQQAHACDLQSATKHAQTARYIENVQLCLKSLPSDYQYDRSIEEDNIRRVNNARRRNGLLPLKVRPDLQAAARWHSLDMAANDFFNHHGQDNRTHGLRISLLDRSLIYDVARENIAMMSGDFEAGSESKLLHELLMDSESHFENIMAADVSHIAVGVVRTDNGVWLTQLFVNEAGELSIPAPIRLTPGQILSFDVSLTALEFSNVHAEQDDTITGFPTFSPSGRSVVPEHLTGDVRLGVRGDKRPTSEDERGYYINLFGPSVTVLPAKPLSAVTKFSSETAG